MPSKALLAIALIAALLVVAGRASAQTNYVTPGGGRVPGVVVMCFTQAPGQGPDGAPEAVPCPDTVVRNSSGVPMGQGTSVPGQYSPPLVMTPSAPFPCGTAGILAKWNSAKGCFDP
jgi:hypothetical protein